MVAVADPQVVLPVDLVEGGHAGLHRLHVGADGLAAAVDASAGAGHDLDEVQVLAAGLELFHELAGLAEAGDHRRAHFHRAGLDPQLLAALHAAQVLDPVVLHLLAGEQEVGAAQTAASITPPEAPNSLPALERSPKGESAPSGSRVAGLTP